MRPKSAVFMSRGIASASVSGRSGRSMLTVCTSRRCLDFILCRSFFFKRLFVMVVLRLLSGYACAKCWIPFSRNQIAISIILLINMRNMKPSPGLIIIGLLPLKGGIVKVLKKCGKKKRNGNEKEKRHSISIMLKMMTVLSNTATTSINNRPILSMVRNGRRR